MVAVNERPKVSSRVDPTSAGQEDLVPGGPAGPGIKTSRNDQDALQARKVRELVLFSERKLQPHRDKRTELLRHFCGPHYGANPDMAEPLNLIYSMVSTLVPSLLLRPRAKVTSTNEELLAFAETFRLAIDDELKTLRFDGAIKLVVYDALFATGVTKCGLRATGPGFDTNGNIAEDAGAVFCDPVDFDDYVIDMTSKTRSGAAVEGNRYMVEYEDAMDSGRFDKDALERMHAAKVASRSAGKSAAVIDGARPTERQQFELYDRLELMDLYLPRERAIVTIAGDPNFEIDGYLARSDWTGPASGPYDIYGFTPVPGNMLDLPVCLVIYDLFLLINRVARKIGRQAERQKDIGLFSKGHEDAAEAVRDASDGEMVGVNNVQDVTNFSIGGVNEAGYKAVAWLQDWLNRISGNTDILGGLNADANTLGQDQMNLASAGVRVNEWRAEVSAAADSTIEKIAGFVWSDPVTVRRLQLEIGEGLKVARLWDPARKQGKFEDYGLKVDPYHFRDRSPDDMYRIVRQWVTDLAQPGMVQAAAAQGMALDVAKIAEITGQYLGIDERNAMFKAIPDIQMNAKPQGGAARTTITNNMGAGRTRAGTLGGRRDQPGSGTTGPGSSNQQPAGNKQPAAAGA